MENKSVVLDGTEYKVGDKCRFEDTYANVTGVIKY